MSPHVWAEEQLAGQPAKGLFAELGWAAVSAAQKCLCPNVLLGHKTNGGLGLREMKGGGSQTHYVPTTQFQTLSTAGSAAELTANTHLVEPDTHQSARNTHQPDPDTHQASADSHQLLATIPPQLAERIPAAGSKPRRNVLRALIADLCRWHALSAREIASLLGDRDQKHLVRTYLSPMVREGVLAYTIPEMENHPDQRYTVPDKAVEREETAP